MTFFTITRAIRSLTFIQFLLIGIIFSLPQQAFTQLQNSRHWLLYAELDGNTNYLNGAVAMHENHVIAARYGSAYIHTNDGNNRWQITHLNRPSVAKNTGFGHSVAIHGNYIIIGAPFDYHKPYYPGEAFIFERNAQQQWQFKARLEAPTVRTRDKFGYSVAITNGHAIVGAPGREGGRAYVYQRDKNGQWILQKTLLPSDALDSDENFGHSVAITSNGTQVVVGNPQRQTSVGAAYIFSKEAQWEQTHKIQAKVLKVDDYFGSSLAISERKLVVGAPQKRLGPGKVYAFVRKPSNEWVQQAILTPPNAQGRDAFGFSVGLSNNNLIVGAINTRFEVSPGFFRRGGAAYIYQNKGDIWRLRDKLLPTNLVPEGEFAQSVAISRDFAVAGYRVATVFRNSANQIITKRSTRSMVEVPQNEIKVFPNPASKILSIQGTFNNRNQAQCSILNQQGQKVMMTTSKVKNGQLTIAIEHLKPGIYFLQVVGMAKTYRFVKQ